MKACLISYFLTQTQKRSILTHLPLINFQTVFCLELFDFFHSKNTGSKTLHTPLNTFPIFGHPTFGFWFQSAHEVTIRLIMSAGGF